MSFKDYKSSVFVCFVQIGPAVHEISNTLSHSQMSEKQLKSATKLVRNVCQPKLKVTNGKRTRFTYFVQWIQCTQFVHFTCHCTHYTNSEFINFVPQISASWSCSINSMYTWRTFLSWYQFSLLIFLHWNHLEWLSQTNSPSWVISTINSAKTLDIEIVGFQRQ